MSGSETESGGINHEAGREGLVESLVGVGVTQVIMERDLVNCAIVGGSAHHEPRT